MLLVVAAGVPSLAQEGGSTDADLNNFQRELRHVQAKHLERELRQVPAMHLAWPTHAGMLAVTAAGARIVAVGDHGTVLLSDDAGRTYRQAREVPTRVLLTSVCFIDDQQGWAVGHWGVVLHTQDGGETWKLLRQDTAVDQPLFSVYFTDRSNGLAVGLWSLTLRTTDGGLSWTPIKMPPLPGGDEAGPSLFQIFRSRDGALFIAAEQGAVFRSNDAGLSWKLLKTGSHGSFWSGVGLPDGSVLVAGLNGKVLRSNDDGETWVDVETGVNSSITALTQTADGGVLGVGLEGAVIDSRDGVHFTAHPRADRAALTAALGSPRGPRLFSMAGVVEPN
jgi:photosystem II stability/assembly factor-like uncharacterized protein